MDEANGLLPNDQLTLFCEVSVVQDSVNIHGHSQRPKLIVPDCTLTTDLSNLLRDQTFSDVKFDVHGEEFAAHKAIMAARSEVFRFVQDKPQKSIYKPHLVPCLQLIRISLKPRMVVSKLSTSKKMFSGKINSVSEVKIEVTCTYREMLNFIYTGKVENLNQMADELLAAADKYALTRLKVSF